jgi:periplasmic protein TonB
LGQRGNVGEAIFAVTLAISLTAHAWVVAALLQSRSQELGSIDVPTEAISINLEATDIIDALESAAAKTAASSSAGAPAEAAKETKEIPDEAKDSEALPDANKLIAEEETRRAVQAEAERQRAADDAEIEKKVKEEAEREETKRRAEEAEQAQKFAEIEEIEKKKREKPQQSAAAGGAGTIGAEEADQSEGRVSASRGSLLNYGASLRALISTYVPRNIRQTSLRLSFSVAPSGGLAAIDVSKPSNNPEVDQRMVELVRKLSLRFPAPPPGASAKELSFNIEIIFR